MNPLSNNSCILTSYLTLKKHPQHGDVNNKIQGVNDQGFVKNNSFLYIKDFYNSLLKTNCDAVIFHDNLSEEFVGKYTNKNIKFLKVIPSNLSNNDYRFFLYQDWLNKNFYEKVFLVDACDVIISKDPSTMNIDHDIYFCEDLLKLSDYRFGMDTFSQICNSLLLEPLLNLHNHILLNMGVIGFNHKNAMKFLNLFCNQRKQSRLFHLNVNMTLGNYIARKYFNQVYSGEPFCSEFKKYQKNRKDVYFIHK
jgi:hypothetical protein